VVDGRTLMSSAAAMAQNPVGLEQLEMFAEGLDHPEGIAIAQDGRIFVGGEAGQIYLIEGDEPPREVANTGGFVLGIAADADRRLYVCDEARHCVLLVDPATGTVEESATGVAGRSIKTPNWPAFDARGNLYVSDSGRWQAGDGLIWVVRPGRRVEIFSEQSVDFPNGLAVAPDGSRLYAAESTPGRIVEIPIRDDGTAGPRRVLCELGLVVPDGVAAAADGSLVFTSYRPDAVFRWSADDGLDVLAADPQGTVLNAPTNVAFTGVGLDVAVLPNLGGWHLVRGRLGVRGTPLPRPTAELIEG
jgi:gluconolactonase